MSSKKPAGITPVVYTTKPYSSAIFCQQCHALYDLLEKRRKEILSHPDFNPENEDLNKQLELIWRRIEIVRNCFEQFCPS